MELFTPEMRNWWKDWELRLIVLFSAFLQVILVTQASRRKSLGHWFLKAVVWATYLTADWAAVLALGILSNRLLDIKEKTGNISPDVQLTAFWAPFLLLHLGGIDTITAYSLEDNELWPRYFATLVAKTGLTCYIYFLALTGSPLAVLAAIMIAVGFTNYGERTLSLYLASKNRLRDSMLSPLESGPIYPRIVEKYSLKKDEGYHVTVDRVVEIIRQEDLAVKRDPESLPLLAYNLFQIFELLFVDLILNIQVLGNCKSLFMEMYSEDAFELVAIELSFMYGRLYTKAKILYNIWGIVRRVVTLSLTCAVLVFFSVAEWKKYIRVDICITFSLLGVAILSEIFMTLLMISSDDTTTWLLKNQNSCKGRAIRFFRIPLCRQPRWSGKVAQFSLLDFSRRRKSLFRVIKLKKVGETVEKHFCINYKIFGNNMKEWICTYLKNKITHDQNISAMPVPFDVGMILKKSSRHEMMWTTGDGFDQTILIWHIATEVFYFSDRAKKDKHQVNLVTNYKMSKKVSRYLLYLLVMYPSMLPAGIGLLRYADTSLEAEQYFEEQRSKMGQKDPNWAHQIANQLGMKWRSRVLECPVCKRSHKSPTSNDVCQAANWLLGVETTIPPSAIKGGKSQSVLFDACLLVSELKELEKTARWKLINKVWAEALLYAAYSCEAYEHSKRLSEGGELLSHVWLLLAHFGISKQLNTSEGHAIAKLLKK
ncbi:uncharacterized protein LOC116199586 [Punica granatum]|uniref:DUF4220 domain-containing protein n=2 Tax=Punica granatum TaxID=22663 RepID=A0A218W1H2_PUNGR|nr:uncharacterized protein LOC116199586 [Punica granatum]OWM66160.1 hypothetical protein CDL15_Pgr013377 [Punica granatum]PKI47608.1 hypothetical protein CRG98_031997 [Punica granatum]